MRLALGLGWDPASGCLVRMKPDAHLVGSASKLPDQKRPNNYRYLDPPVRSCQFAVNFKSPSAHNRQKKNSETEFAANTGSRKHVVFSAHCSSSCLIAAEGRLSYFVNSQLEVAIAEPTVNGLQVFSNQMISA
jgi:hypothetical protein